MNLLKNFYVVVGVIIFVFVLAMGLWLRFGWRESLLAAAALTVVAIVLEWLRNTFGLDL
ncbi:hypothetical protein [Chloroflexus aggregans]|uniref:Uncharacterized protein n=1 Tax=Chloroflexus aggregans (strain MD-66 / DSM 9485) TaxID=326427 RepID=B8G5V1_CHLAD|nr:hypothetical protein [Chloroflexus aggregans]ACL23812.1 hypothetical protein Cagg_0893 [Chloroflexus aggregans DSM 9485]